MSSWHGSIPASASVASSRDLAHAHRRRELLRRVAVADDVVEVPAPPAGRGGRSCAGPHLPGGVVRGLRGPVRGDHPFSRLPARAAQPDPVRGRRRGRGVGSLRIRLSVGAPPVHHAQDLPARPRAAVSGPLLRRGGGVPFPGAVQGPRTPVHAGRGRCAPVSVRHGPAGPRPVFSGPARGAHLPVHRLDRRVSQHRSGSAAQAVWPATSAASWTAW